MYSLTQRKLTPSTYLACNTILSDPGQAPKICGILDNNRVDKTKIQIKTLYSQTT